MNLKIRKNDIVVVRAGEFAKKTGKVLRVFPEERHVLVEGVNLVWKHIRKNQENRKGARIKKEAPLPISRVMVICQSCNKPTRVGIKVAEDGTRFRVCKKCKQGVSLAT
jgi:large subunit ribosomal protein L24